MRAGDKSATHVPGEPGIWVLVLGDLFVFTLLFFTQLYYRALAPAEFAIGHNSLDFRLGLINTLLMLTSSLCVALAIGRVRAAAFGSAIRLLCGGIACGAAFVGVKAIEWSEKIGHGLTLGSGDYFMLYFMLTGIHLLHVLFGLGVLVALALMVRRLGRTSGALAGRSLLLIESGGVFWHVVDLLWIVLFALFYLMP